MAATKKVIKIENVIIKKDFNARFIFDENKLEELKKSILSRGLMYPITVKSVKLTEENIDNFEIWKDGVKHSVPDNFIDNEDIYALIDGERRLRCHIVLLQEGHPLKGITATIENNNLKDDDALLTSFLKNTGENFAPLEEAMLFEKLINVYNWTVEDVAESTGKSVGTIKSRINLLNDSGKNLQNALNSKDVTLTAAQEIIKQSEGDIEKQDELLEKEKENKEISSAKKKERERKIAEKVNKENEDSEENDEVEEISDIDPLDQDEDAEVEEIDEEINNFEKEVEETFEPEIVDNRKVEFPKKIVIDVAEHKNDYNQLLDDLKTSIKDGTNKNYISFSYGLICKLGEILDLDLEEDLGAEMYDYCENLMV